jgi:aminopeptidase YwaD
LNPSRLRLLFVSSCAVLALVLAACGGSGSSPDTQTATSPTAVTSTTETAPSPTAVTTTLPKEPDGDRIFNDVKHLSDTIGPRPAGTEFEVAAAEFIAQRFRSLGYEVALQEFSVGTQINRTSSLDVVQPSSEAIATLPFDSSATGEVQGSLVEAGIGRPEEFPAEARGAIVLIERGTLMFSEKVANAERAGAIGAVIYNNEGGILRGGLSGGGSSIPVVSISQEAGAALSGRISAGAVNVSLSVGQLGSDISHNVIARPNGKECETVTGGHYDSVPQAPGASDNATGTAAVLEIAAVLAGKGEMGSHCFVLFGAEELGLIGSRFYVQSLSEEARGRLKAMLNFDMVGVGTEGWRLIGTPQLVQRMNDIVNQLQIEGARPSELSQGLGSDHASFQAAGIPSIMFHRWEDNLLHTPEDVSGRVSPQYLEEAARMGVALLESLSTGS